MSLADHETHEFVLSAYADLSASYDWVLILSPRVRKDAYSFSVQDDTLMITASTASAERAVDDVLARMAATDGIVVNDGTDYEQAVKTVEHIRMKLGPSVNVSIASESATLEQLAAQLNGIIIQARGRGYGLDDLIKAIH